LGDKEKHPLVILLKGIPGNPLENPHQYSRQKDMKILHHKDSSTMFDGTATRQCGKVCRDCPPNVIDTLTPVLLCINTLISHEVLGLSPASAVAESK